MFSLLSEFLKNFSQTWAEGKSLSLWMENRQSPAQRPESISEAFPFFIS